MTHSRSKSPRRSPATLRRPFDPVTDRQLRQLKELTEIGMSQARKIGQRMKADLALPVSKLDLSELDQLATDYEQISEIVRLAMMLETRIAEGGLNLADQPPIAAPEPLRKAEEDLRGLEQLKSDLRNADAVTFAELERMLNDAPVGQPPAKRRFIQ